MKIHILPKGTLLHYRGFPLELVADTEVLCGTMTRLGGKEGVDRLFEGKNTSEQQEEAQKLSPPVGDRKVTRNSAPVNGQLRAWPDPTDEMLADPRFEAVWQRIKSWDISVPEVYGGYCGATGNHVRAILDALKSVESSTQGRPSLEFDNNDTY